MAREHQAVIFGENGAGDKIMPCDHTYWYKDLYATPFTGLAGTGMSWDETRSFDLWQEYGKLNYFLENYFLNEVNLEEDIWVPGYAQMDNDNSQYAECLYLQYVETNHHRFVGVIFNRNWNFWTENDGFGDCVEITLGEEEDILFSENMDAVDVSYDANNRIMIDEGNFDLPDFGQAYRIEYFDPDNLQYNGTCNDNSMIGPVYCDVDNVGINGLDLKHFPSLTFENRPILLFRAFRDNGEDVFSTKSVTQSVLDDLPIANSFSNDITDILNLSSSQSQLLVYPNPAEKSFNLESRKEGSFRIFNEYGALVASGRIHEGVNQISIQHLAGGVYCVNFENQVFRLVVLP